MGDTIKAKKQWYAIYSRPRWEKKVSKLLLDRGFESYCPLNKVRRQWSDRIKVVEEPLFRSYVFVKVSETEMKEVRMINGVVNFVYWNGKPAMVREREIENIRKYLKEYEHLEVQPIDLVVNDTVLVEDGLFMHQKATVLRVLRKKLVLRIESMGCALIAHVSNRSVSLWQSQKSPS